MEIVKGPTPNGGAYAQIYYLDSNDKITDKENAVKGNVLEFDENDRRICETHFIIKKTNDSDFNTEDSIILND